MPCFLPRLCRLVGAAALLLVAVLLPVAAVAQNGEGQDGGTGAVEEIATVVRIQGTVEAVGPDETARPLAPADRVARGEALRTGPGARVLVRLDDGSELTLGGDGELVLDSLIAPPAGQGPGLLSLLSGAFLLQAAKTPDASVRTPVATIGIRGTTVWGGALDNPLDVLLQEGRVEVSTPAGVTVLDQPGQGTMVSAAGDAPGPASVWPAEKVARAVATVSFAP